MLHMPSFGMWLVLGILGVLFFGKRLPEVGKSVAGAIVNFKKGLKEAQEEIERSSETPARPAISSTAAPALPSDAKFDPYTGQPIDKPKFDPYTGKPLADDTHETHSDTHETVA